IGGPDAGFDGALAFVDDLPHEGRVRHMSARHADEIHFARRYGVPRCSDVLNPGGVESREVGGRSDFAGKIQVRRAWHSLDRNDVRQTGVSVDMSSDDVEEVD